MRIIKDLELKHESAIGRMVRSESRHQLEKWGVQSRTPAEWMLYLSEEVGELSAAIADYEYDRGGTRGDVIKEAVQVATLALKISEMYCFNN